MPMVAVVMTVPWVVGVRPGGYKRRCLEMRVYDVAYDVRRTLCVVCIVYTVRRTVYILRRTTVRRTWYSVCEDDDMRERMRNRMYQGICIRTYMRVRVCGYACARVWLCVCAYVVMYACVLCMCGCVCGHVCVGVCSMYV